MKLRNRQNMLTLHSFEYLETKRVLDGIPFTNLELESPGIIGMHLGAFGDIDGDSDNDIVTYSRVTFELHLFENQGDSFDFPRLIGSEFGVGNIEMIDIDMDGDLDIVADSHLGIQLHKNTDGKGSFARQALTSVGSLGSFVHSPSQFVDIDADNDLDAIILSADGINVLTNDGNLNFSVSQVIEGGRELRAMTVDDMDGDGNIDLIAYSWNRDVGVQIYLNRSGVFELERRIEAHGPHWRIQVEDYDRDGDKDLLLWSAFSALFVENTEDGHRTHSPSISVDLGSAGAVDLTNDGSFEMIFNDHDGALLFRLDTDFELQRIGKLEIDGNFTSVVDLDNDGDHDLVEVNAETNEIRLFENKNGSFDSMRDLFSTDHLLEPANPTFIDWDRDGDLDILASSRNSREVFIYEFDRQSQKFLDRRLLASGFQDIGKLITIDFDSDNDDDLLVTQGSHDEVLLLENENGRLDNPIRLFSLFSGRGSALKAADFDNDGDEDLFFSQTKSIYLKRNDDGVFADEIAVATEVNSEFELADVDGDGRLDIVTTSFGTDLPAWSRQTDTGVFSTVTILAEKEVDTNLISIADINGDGKLELGFVSTERPKHFYWLTEPQTVGGFWEVHEFEFRASNAHDINLSDLDLDGDPDLIRSSTGIRWYQNLNGAGDFGDRNAIAGPRLSYSEAELADFDADGDIDILVHSIQDDYMVVLRNEIVSNDLPGDFDANGVIEAADIDVLLAAVHEGKQSAEFDIDSNGVVNHYDSKEFVEQIAKTSYGDANFDGVFDSQDLIRLFQSGSFERPNIAASWATGDFNGDQRFTSRDLVLAFQRGQFAG